MPPSQDGSSCRSAAEVAYRTCRLGTGMCSGAAPWMDYAGYGALLRDADVLLCPMLSPHTSYPVLEMAASGGIAVTNTFLTKTEAALQAISPSIIAAEPTMEGFTTGLVRAARQVNMATPRETQLNMPRDWGISLDHIAQRITEVLRALDTGA